MHPRGLLRRATTGAGALFLALLLFPPSSFPESEGYGPLVEILKTQQKEEAPLYAFGPFEENGVQRDAAAESLPLFDQHPELVRNIRKDLGPGEIRWRLERSRHRLLFVPERRAAFAALFEAYCREVIRYTLEKTRLADPYTRMEVPAEANPEVPEEGVAVFVVHNIAEEVRDTYVFSNPDRGSLKVDLSRKAFLGEVGSYTSYVEWKDGGEPAFTGNRYTLWRTTARNPFTVLSVPVEETLHIAVRGHTHRAIREAFAGGDARDAAAMQEIVAYWMAVEEALVGGVLHALLPRFLEKRAPNLPLRLVQEDVDSRSEFDRYRYLQRAIEVVRSLGPRKAIRMYATRPLRFARLLGRPGEAAGRLRLTRAFPAGAASPGLAGLVLGPLPSSL